jgi:sucrose-6-phosphate hydrolase SacC (GH32 family)
MMPSDGSITDRMTMPESPGQILEKEHLFIGWMSNWKYANIVPTERWRSAMTIARELGLEIGGWRYGH